MWKRIINTLTIFLLLAGVNQNAFCEVAVENQKSAEQTTLLSDSQTTLLSDSSAEAQKSSSQTTADASITTTTATATATATGGSSPTSLSSIPVEIDPATGTAATSISISTPPGRAGIQPNISLVYNSSLSNGILGVGWTLELGSIQRSTKRGTPKYNASDTFVLVQPGSTQELVYDNSTSFYRMKTEGAFMKIERFGSSPGNWVVTDKKGTKYYFGQAENSRQFRPGDPGVGVFKWCLNRVEDVHGNFMTISYFKDQGQIYPEFIDYTGNVGVAPFARVEFLRENRLDISSSYRSGFLVKTTQVISQVRTYVNSILQSRYHWEYTRSPETLRFLLTSLTQYSPDGTKSLPSTLFTYRQQSNPLKGFDLTGGWSIPAGAKFSEVQNGRNADLGVRVADINSDGYPDLVKSYADCCNNMTRQTFIHDRNISFNEDLNWAAPNSRFIFLRNHSNADRDNGVRLADANGDGWVDFIRNFKHYSGGFDGDTAINLQGSGWSETAAWQMPNEDIAIVHETAEAPNDFTEFMGTVFADVDGDGYEDVVRSKEGSISSHRTFLNNAPQGGIGWREVPSWATASSTFTNLADGAALVDLNGDGLPDILYCKNSDPNIYSTCKVYMNTGYNWLEDPTSPWASSLGTTDLSDGSTQFGDVNGDGLTDVIVAGNSRLWTMLNTGNGWRDDVAWNLTGGANFQNLGTRVLDANSDGMLDYLIHFNGETPKLYLNRGVIPDLLVSVNNGIGGVTTVTYDTSTHYQNTFLPFPIAVVKSVNVSDSLGSSYTTQYSYANGLWSAREREFRGFGYVKVTDSEGSYTETRFLQDDVFKGRIQSQESHDALGNLFGKTVNTWHSAPIAPGVNFVALAKKQDFTYDGNQVGRKTSESFSYDLYGNLEQDTQSGEVDINTDEDIGNDRRTINVEYAYNTSLWLLALPKHTVISNQGGSIVRQSWFYYDGATDFETPPTKGLLTQKKDWGGNALGAVHPIVQYTYDAYGNLLTTKDPNNNTTTITYDATYHMFPLTATNALGFTIVNEYYGVNGVPLDSLDGFRGLFGQLKSTTDPNNKQGRKTYDTFGRVVATVSPLDSISAPTTTIDYVITSTYVKITTHQREKHGTPDTIDSVQFFDGLNRLIQAKSESETPGQFVVSGQTEYNSRGLPEKKYLPFFSTNLIDSIDPIDLTKPHATITYDAMGRVIRATNPDGTYSSIIYDDWTTIAVNENGFKQESVFDAYGRLINKVEYSGADGRSPYYPAVGYQLYGITYYQYDSEGNLTRVEDAGGNITTIEYDTLGRKTSMNDPDMGVWQYGYDGSGNLKWQLDSKGQRIDFIYDVLNRLTNKTDAGALNVNYTYDDALVTNSKGRLTKAAYDLNGDAKFAYDVLGRENESTKKIDGLDYNVKRDYDALSRLTSLKYPDQAEVLYSYNAAGQIERVEGPPVTIPNNIQFGAVTTKTGSAVSSLTFSHTIGTGRNRVLVVGIGTEHGSTTRNVASVTFNGVPLTKINETITTASRYNRSSLWYLLNPPSGTYNITVTMNGGGGTVAAIVAGAVSLTGVKQAPPEVNATARGSSTSPSVSITTLTPGAWIVDNIATELSTATITVNSSQTQRYNVTHTGNMRDGASTKLRSLAGATTMRWKISSTSRWALVAAAFAPAPPDTSTPVYISNVDYNAAGQITRIVYGNGDVTVHTYDPLTFRLTNMLTTNLGAETLQNLSYTYDSAGNIVSITDSVRTASQTFAYDELSRLIEASGAYGTKQYAYDPIGNLIYKEGITYTYSGVGAGPHAVTSLSDGTTFQYDANGNMTRMANGGLVWDYLYDSENHLQEVKKGNATKAQFQYDGDGGRTKKTIYYNSSSGLSLGESDPKTLLAELKQPERMQGLFDLWNFVSYVKDTVDDFLIPEAEAQVSPPSVATRFIGSLYEEQEGNQTKHIFVGGLKVVSVTSGNLIYYHADHLGGTNLITDSSGVVKELNEYLPFGEFWRHESYAGASGASEPWAKALSHFTGKRLDDEIGLYYFGARYYNPTVGRFITADRVVQYPYNPQNLNRYSYAHNNPVNLVDPTGEFAWFIPMIIGAIKGAIVGAAIGAGVAAATGGDIGKGAMLGAISGAFIGGTTGIMGHFVRQGVTYSTGIQILAYAEAGAYAGAVSAAVMGSDPLQGAGLGALSGAAFGAIGGLGGKSWQWDLARIPLAGAVGGGISELSGGSFIDGFIFASSIAGADFTYRAILRSQGINQGASMKPATKAGQPKLDKNGNLIDNKPVNPDVSVSQPGIPSKPAEAMDGFWEKFLNFVAGETGPVMNFLGQNVPGVQGLSLAHDTTGYFLAGAVGGAANGLLFNFQTMPPIYGLNLAGSAINDNPAFIGIYEANRRNRR